MDNETIKKTLLETHSELEQNLAEMDACVQRIFQLNDEVNRLIEKNLLAGTENAQEIQISFNLQYLQLQSQMQEENRSYTAVSNIMRTKHDTVKNSISNIR
jgi:hypothetical protein